MATRTGPMNYQLQQLLSELDSKVQDSKFWKRVVKDLNKPARQRRTVNVYKIEKFAREGETVLVPGNVLSVGEITKKVDVAAVKFSKEAVRKITDANGKILSIQD